MLKIKNFFIVLILSVYLSYGQSQFNDLNIGASFGLASEMGDVSSEGFNPVLGLNISKHISSQVSLSTKMMLGSLEGGSNADAFDVNFMGGFMLWLSFRGRRGVELLCRAWTIFIGGNL